MPSDRSKVVTAVYFRRTESSQNEATTIHSSTHWRGHLAGVPAALSACFRGVGAPGSGGASPAGAGVGCHVVRPSRDRRRCLPASVSGVTWCARHVTAGGGVCRRAGDGSCLPELCKRTLLRWRVCAVEYTDETSLVFSWERTMIIGIPTGRDRRGRRQAERCHNLLNILTPINLLIGMPLLRSVFTSLREDDSH